LVFASDEKFPELKSNNPYSFVIEETFPLKLIIVASSLGWGSDCRVFSKLPLQVTRT